jgi:hypothetical protein
MAKLFATPIDLNRNQLLNALLQILVAAPVTPLEGQIWYDSVSKQPYFYDGTTPKAIGRTTPGGNDKQVQFNNAGVLGGTSLLTINSNGVGWGNGLARLTVDGSDNSIISFASVGSGSTEFAKIQGSSSSRLELYASSEVQFFAKNLATNNFDIAASFGNNNSSIFAGLSVYNKSRFTNPLLLRVADNQESEVLRIDNFFGFSFGGFDKRGCLVHCLLSTLTANSFTPIYAKGVQYFDDTTDKLKFGGAAAFQTVLSEELAATTYPTFSYVDNLVSGLDVKASVRVATTANLPALSGLLTVDGVVLVAGNRVLVKDQATGSQNGIYVVAAGAWARSADANSDAEVTSGLFTFVEEGTINANSGWTLTTDGVIVVGTTALSFTQFSSSAAITAGTGLTLSGSVLSISTGYTGQGSISTVGTITTGVWNGTAIPVANGGTGAITAAAARANLGAITKVAADIGDGVAVSYVVTHNLGTRDLTTNIYDNATFEDVICDIVRTSINTLTVSFTTAPTASQFRIVITG